MSRVVYRDVRRGESDEPVQEYCRCPIELNVSLCGPAPIQRQTHVIHAILKGKLHIHSRALM